MSRLGPRSSSSFLISLFFFALLLTLLPPRSYLILNLFNSSLPLQPKMVQRCELPLRHPKKSIQNSRRTRDISIPKRRHYCFSNKRRPRLRSLRWFKPKHIRSSRYGRHRTRIQGHRHASAAKIHKSQPPDLTPPDKPPSLQLERVSILATGGFPSLSLPPEDTTFHPPLDTTSLTSEHRSSEDEGYFEGGSDYTLCDTDDDGDEGIWENGRIYCYGGKYHFPIDGLQQEVEFLMHRIWEKYSPVGQRLFLAPVNTPKMHNALDNGSGPSYWVEDFAGKYPHTTVTGVDLFPQELIELPNVKLRKDDVESHWPAQNKYEFIHSRDMILAIRDWDTLLSRAFESLEPGGWIELQEIHYLPHSNNGSPHSTEQPLADFFSKIAEGMKVLGVDLNAITLLAEKMRAAGFVNVTTNTSYIPVSRNNQSTTEDNAATSMKTAIYLGLQGTALGPLTRGLKWPREQVEMYLISIRNCLREGLRDTKLPVYIIYGQRP